MPSGTCQIAQSVTSGARNNTAVRAWPRNSPIRIAAISRYIAGGMNSNIVIYLRVFGGVIVLIALQKKTETFGDQDHGETRQETKRGAKAEPTVNAKVALDANDQLRDDGQLEVGVPAGQGLNTLFEALGRHDIRVSSMRNKSNRLEELFIRLVEGKDRKG